MPDIWSFVWTYGAAYALAGITLSIVEQGKWGLSFYRFLYDLFHKDPIPVGEVKGFFYRQSMRSKVFRALVFAGVLGFVPGFNGTGLNVATLFILPLIQTPALLVGLWVGTVIVVPLLRNRIKIFDAVDALGERTSKENVDMVTKQATTVGGVLIDAFLGIPRSLSKAVKDLVWPDPVVPVSRAAPAPPRAAGKTPTVPLEPKDPPVDYVDEFVNRSRK